VQDFSSLQEQTRNPKRIGWKKMDDVRAEVLDVWGRMTVENISKQLYKT
jgi:hypothetical protein